MAAERASPHRRNPRVSPVTWGRAATALAGLALASVCGGAHATADGPDHYRVRGVSPDRHLMLRAEPSTSSAPLARIPANATCLRSLGCQGGLTFEEFTTLDEQAKQRRATERPRWCKVDYRGRVGWVAGRYLAEEGCPAEARR